MVSVDFHKRRNVVKKIIISALVVAGLTFTGAASAKKLKFQMSSKAGDWAHTYMANHAPVLSELTNGELQIEGLPTKSVVPHRETIDAVANGILDGDFNAIAYFAGRDPAFAIMGDLIAGYDTPKQYQEYCMHGGGKEMLQKIYDSVLPNKIHVLGCGPYGKEALVSKVPINGVADLKGVKIRSPEGLAADVFRRAGASPSSIPFSEVYTSLEKGIVDAADASVYINNHASGFHKIAKYPLYPGIHSMANLQTIINKKVFNKLSKQNQTALTIWTYWTWTAKLRDAGLDGRAQVAKDKAAGDLTIMLVVSIKLLNTLFIQVFTLWQTFKLLLTKKFLIS
jgi:TRAP-type mannitol/chloroaromatic compound transport system substrate-binding protein